MQKATIASESLSEGPQCGGKTLNFLPQNSHGQDYTQLAEFLSALVVTILTFVLLRMQFIIKERHPE